MSPFDFTCTVQVFLACLEDTTNDEGFFSFVFGATVRQGFEEGAKPPWPGGLELQLVFVYARRRCWFRGVVFGFGIGFLDILAFLSVELVFDLLLEVSVFVLDEL